MHVRHKATVVRQERRHHPRITAPERALVAVAGDALGLPYNVTDISEGGLAFIYLGESPLSVTDSQVDIYLNEDLQIGLLPVTVVADRNLEGYYIPKRRCSLRFGDLTETQRRQLQMFISRHSPAASLDS